MKFTLRKRSIASAWFISYMFLVGVSILVNLVAYINVENQIEQQTSSYAMEMLQSKKNEIDNLHAQLRRISYELQNNEVIQKTAFSHDIIRYPGYNIVEVSSELNRYASTLDDFKNIYIYFHKMDYCVGAYKANFSDNFFNVHVAESGIDYSSWIKTIREKHTDEFITFNSEGTEKKNVLYMQSIYNLERFIPYATIVVEISPDKLLLPSTIEEYGEGFAILDENNSVFLAKNQKKVEKLTGIVDKYGVETGISAFKEQVMVVINSEVNEWKYVYLVDKSVFRQSVERSRRILILWNLIGICAAAVLARLSANKNYKPLGRLVSPLVKKDNVSLVDLYDAEKIIANIMQENKVYNSYAKSLQNAAVKSAFLSHLLTDKIKTDNQKEILDSLGIVFKYEKYLVVLFYIDIKSDIFFDDKNDDADETYQLVRLALLNVLNDLADERFLIEHCDVNGMLGCIVNIKHEKDAETFVDIIENLEEIMYKNFNISFIAGVSDTRDNIYDLSYCYDEAMSCVEKNFFNVCGVIKYSDTSEETAETVVISHNKEEKLINAISVCDTDTVEREIDDVFENVITSGSKTLTNVKIILYDFVRIMTKIISENGMQEDDTKAISEIIKLMENINMHNGVSETKSILKEIIGEFCMKNMAATKNKTEILANKAKSFIDENYSDSQLSVPVIAQQCGVSAAYLSSKFKKESGIGVLEYISSKRVELAKEILLNENVTIEQVSERVGYENRRSFVRMFTQYAGVSPSRYRAMIKLEMGTEKNNK